MFGARVNDGLERISRNPEVVVVLAWGITLAVFLSGHWSVAGDWLQANVVRTVADVEYALTAQAYFISLVLVLAAIATALALSLESPLRGFLLSLPGPVIMVLAIVVMDRAMFVVFQPILVSLLAFFISAIWGPPLLMRSFKDDDARSRTYFKALQVMAVAAAVGILSSFLV